MNTQDLLAKLVSINSIFPNEDEISVFISSYLSRKGFEVKRIKTEKNRSNIVATFGKSKKYLGFYGHMDTVPNNFKERKDPFTMKVKDNIASGLGVEDMKGGIAAIIKAGEYAVQNKFPVKLIFGCDEENISQGAHDLVNSRYLSDLEFLIAGESGQATKDARSFATTYGRKGRILFEAYIKGEKAHAAEQGKGISAIFRAAYFISLLMKIKLPGHKVLGRADVVVQSIKSESDSFSIPEEAHITFSLLTVPGISSEGFLGLVKKMMRRNRIEGNVSLFKRKTPYGESYEIDRKEPFLKKIEEKILKIYGVQPSYSSSVADENVFANRLKIPVISLGPVGGNGHGSKEWLNLDSLKTVEAVYKQIISLYNEKES